MRKTAIIIMFAMLAGICGAIDQPVYPCYRLQKEPVMDGQITAQEWETVPAITGFWMLGKQAYALHKQARFKAGWDDKNLYLAIQCEEPDPGKIAAVQKDGSDSLWQDDSVEIFLMPEDNGPYFQLIVNAKGSRSASRRDGGVDVPVNHLMLKTGTRIGTNDWILELSIPFELLAAKPGEGRRWRINIGRNMLNDPATERCTSWSCLAKWFHEPANFAVFEFYGTAISPEKAETMANQLKEPYVSALRRQVDTIAAQSGAFAAAIREGLKIGKLSAQAQALKQSWEMIGKVAGMRTNDDGILRTALVQAGDLPDSSRDFADTLALEELLGQEKM